jgi:hypothetical protein
MSYNLSVGTSLEGKKTSTLYIREKSEKLNGLALSATCVGVPPTTASVFAPGCIMVRTDGTGGLTAQYVNRGTAAVPVWEAIEGGAGGTPETGVTATEYSSDGRHFVTVLTFTGLAVGTIAAGDKAYGKKIYTLPAGAQLVKASYMSVGLTTAGSTKTDTPDVGIGSVIATGNVALLNGTATFEDYLTGQTAADVNGTATVAGPICATAGALTGIALNSAASAKTIHLNVADGWNAGAVGALTATGTVAISWEKLA